jgi:hypothetical protein
MGQPGITSIKSFEYRDAVEEWGNTYHFDGDPPSDEAGWLDLFVELAALEKTVLPITTSIVRAYCYDDTDDHSVFTLDTDAGFTSVAGTATYTTGSYLAPGDAAMWIRWKTARLNSNGKPIYLRKYYHGVIVTPAGGDGDTIQSGQHTALEALADSLNTVTGDWPGLVGPDGVVPGANKVSTYATTRTLKRRGARPH